MEEKAAATTSAGGKTKRWVLWKKLVTRRKESWRWKFLGSSGFKWKRLNLKLSFIDNMLFKIVSVFEAIVLVTTLSFFFLCCGCHF